MAVLPSDAPFDATRADTSSHVTGSMQAFLAVAARPEFVALVHYFTPVLGEPECVRVANAFRVLLAWRARAADEGTASTEALALASPEQIATVTRKFPAAWTMTEITGKDLQLAHDALAVLYGSANDPEAAAIVATTLRRPPSNPQILALQMAYLLGREGLGVPDVPAPCCDACAASGGSCASSASPGESGHALPPANTTPAVLSSMVAAASPISCPTGACGVRP